MPLRMVFMGTPDFSVPTLQALAEAGHDIVACYTQPPRPAGRRGLELKPSPVQLAAEKLGIKMFTPISLKDEHEQWRFKEHNADVAIVVAYGLLLPRAILNAPKHGCFNGHASLLPRWRGAAPIQRAIMAGDTQTGIMVMKMETGLDTGPVAMTTRLPIDEETTAGDLHDKLAEAGASLMVEAMNALETGSLSLVPQSEDGVIYASKITKDETRIDWSRPANEVLRHIHGLSPFPGSWFEMPLGKKSVRVKVLRAEIAEGTGEAGTVLDDSLNIACANGAVRLVQLQRAGSKIMNGSEFLHGNTLPAGTSLA